MPELKSAPIASSQNCNWQDIDTIILGVPCAGCDVMDGYAAHKPGMRFCKWCGRRVELGGPWEEFVRERIDSGLYRMVGDGGTIMMNDDWGFAVGGMRDRMVQLFVLNGCRTGANVSFAAFIVLLLALCLFGYIAAQWQPWAVQTPSANPPARTATPPYSPPSAAYQEPVDVPAEREPAPQAADRVGPIGFGSAPLTPEEEYWRRVRNVQGRATGPDRSAPSVAAKASPENSTVLCVMPDGAERTVSVAGCRSLGGVVYR